MKIIISPSMRLSYEKWVKPRLSKKQKVLIKELASSVASNLGISDPNASGDQPAAPAGTVRPIVGADWRTA